MRKWEWDKFTNEDIKDEITLIKKGLESIVASKSFPKIQKQKLFDEYLDKLNSLYDEQRKRGTFK